MSDKELREECEILKNECEDLEDAMEYIDEVIDETRASREEVIDMLKEVFNDSGGDD